MTAPRALLLAALLLLPAAAQEREPAPAGKPKGLETYVTGDPSDSGALVDGPTLLLMGGGADVDAAFVAWRDAASPEELRPEGRGPDVVVLRTSGADGYNAYLFEQIGGFDSVETLVVTTPAQADSPWVQRRLDEAEAIFIAGGDQATYARAWKGTRLERALEAAWRRGAALGGTSAGAAVLGKFSFTALHGTVNAPPAMRDPYREEVTLDPDFLPLSFLDGAIVDTHFRAREREGRLLAFLARIVKDGWHPTPLGIGLDEATALVVTRGGRGRVFGRGQVTLYRPTNAPEVCAAGTPLTFTGVAVWPLRAGQTVDLPCGPDGAPARTISVVAGILRDPRR